ncbi:MAG: peptide chain release factor N(5)-glutamine methyltransferase [Candidatus Riflebacteria bacterium HGW-Riflebacteria-2]|jgi:release factor glutamine methyltransferase|nr:MAG: peptide chain release factor N(5)-glutamine methyltransferase [Candidatus Riflebacteria bacterium HGW-Riflebacteria-2]
MKQIIQQVISQARGRLEEAGVDDAAFNVNCMAAAILGVDIGRLPLHWPEKAGADFGGRLDEMVRRRCAHEPLQYILRSWSFLDMTLVTRPGALIPRSETEEVFMAAAKAIEESISAGRIPQNFRFADVGTGTGALGLAMARRFTEATGVLIDISEAALEVATENLCTYKDVCKRIGVVRSNLLEAVQPTGLHVIISNPPYVNRGDIATLMPEVSEYEPLLALDGGTSGLDLIELLIVQAAEKLLPDGLLIFEHGHGQRAAIKELIGNGWSSWHAGDDLSGRERYFILTRKG